MTPTLKAAKVAAAEIGAGAYSGRVAAPPARLPLGRRRPLDPGPSPSPTLGCTAAAPATCWWSTRPACSTRTPPAPCSHADETGARVALVGDRHQLPAVGRGGVLDLAARCAPDRTADPGRRCTASPTPRYAELSLRMRTRDRPRRGVRRAPAPRGQIVVHPSEVERQHALAVRASLGDLVVADTREQVAGSTTAPTAIRGRHRPARPTDAVTTGAGERIGVGDRVATRRNDPDLGVANRETWTVTAVASDGAPAPSVGEAGPTHPARRLRPRARRARLRHHRPRRPGRHRHRPPTSSIGDHTGAAVGLRRDDPRPRSATPPTSSPRSLEEAREQWIDVFARDRADLGPAHAARLAAEAIDRYGPKANRPARRPSASAPRHEDDLGYRSPMQTSGPSIGL